ncbi:ABC transporter substrate-binding protein [Bradyrhizobium sp. BR13661]|jgi:iron(III) transport system substrate-binding protein|uniref:ABC transporter substrate-binding protein n=1 Tax=Bradyrhizobium sp. BR13661 TaxID=2940622 RepID=UPI002473251B|nr:ABC transporter substrate-binding protein [Bradyrhizobium sp. BR13661]MDH6262209.1 iron(III) transport system substrate-binding protein [Bradyrhizobium sp. BR13661]
MKAANAMVLCVGILLAAPTGAQQMQDVAPAKGPLAAIAENRDKLHIVSTTEASEVSDLLADFRALYPRLETVYSKANSYDIYNRIVESPPSSEGSGDVIWSSAMDLQIKLVNDGYAQPYVSKEITHIPDWAVWKNEAYAITAEPIVIVYNKNLVAESDVPKTRSDLTSLLSKKPDAYRGKIASYDPEQSGAGFLFITRDSRITKTTWEMVRAFGGAGIKLYSTTGTVLDRISSGEHLIAYNVIGSYAIERAKEDTSIGVVFPADYITLMSRIAFIPVTARHPESAKLFLDYLLSERGQKFLLARSIGSVRLGIGAGGVIPAERSDAIKPIHIGPELLTYLDQSKRASFLKEWRRALQDR